MGMTSGKECMSAYELAHRMRDTSVTLVFVASSTKITSQKGAKWSRVPINLDNHRFWPTLAPALAGIKPVYETKAARIYNGTDVIRRLLARDDKSSK